MNNLRLGDLIIQAKEDGLSMRSSKSLSALGDVQLEDIPTLLEFMKSYLEESANRRSSFRLDLTELNLIDYQELRISLLTDQKEFAVRPLDISLTGVLVETNEYVDDRETVQVNISYGGKRVSMNAKIVRSNESSRRIALHFPDVMQTDGTLNAPVELTKIFDALEGGWLDKSLGLKWNSA
jgi:hypothetical protein